MSSNLDSNQHRSEFTKTARLRQRLFFNLNIEALMDIPISPVGRIRSKTNVSLEIPSTRDTSNGFESFDGTEKSFFANKLSNPAPASARQRGHLTASNRAPKPLRFTSEPPEKRRTVPAQTTEIGVSGKNTRRARRPNLPATIANALVRIYEDDAFCSLGPASRRVLACIVRYGVHAENSGESIYIKKLTIATKLLVCEKTVYKSLNELEKNGWINRDAQTPRGRMLKEVGRIRITASCAEAIGLANSYTVPNARLSDGNGVAISINPAISDVYGTSVVKSTVVNGFTKEHSSSKKQPATPGPSDEANSKKPPADLMWMVESNGLSVKAVFSLMKIARESGRGLLSDIAAACRTSLAPLHGSALFAYVRALTQKNTDYAWVRRSQAAQRETIEAERREAASTQAFIREQIDKLAGRVFVSADRAEYVFESAGVLRTVLDKGIRRTAFVLQSHAAPIIRAILDGQLREVTNDGRMARPVASRTGKQVSATARACIDGLRATLLGRRSNLNAT